MDSGYSHLPGYGVLISIELYEDTSCNLACTYYIGVPESNASLSISSE